MHVSAATRLMPTPPARVESRKQNVSEPGLQKRSMACCLASPVMDPSSRSKLKPRDARNSPKMLSMMANCEKSSTRWPSHRSLGSSFASRMSLPLALSIASRASASSMPLVTDSSTPRMRKGWLQHLRSSICMLSSDGKGAWSSPWTKTSRRASSTARYIFFCRRVISTHTMVSSSGASESSPLSTSPFWRCSRYGRIFSLSSSTWSASVSVP